MQGDVSSPEGQRGGREGASSLLGKPIVRKLAVLSSLQPHRVATLLPGHPHSATVPMPTC